LKLPMKTIATITRKRMGIDKSFWKYVKRFKTCMEVEVKKPNRRMMGSAEVYVEQ